MSIPDKQISKVILKYGVLKTAIELVSDETLLNIVSHEDDLVACSKFYLDNADKLTVVSKTSLWAYGGKTNIKDMDKVRNNEHLTQYERIVDECMSYFSMSKIAAIKYFFDDHENYFVPIVENTRKELNLKAYSSLEIYDSLNLKLRLNTEMKNNLKYLLETTNKEIKETIKEIEKIGQIIICLDQEITKYAGRRVLTTETLFAGGIVSILAGPMIGGILGGAIVNESAKKNFFTNVNNYTIDLNNYVEHCIKLVRFIKKYINSIIDWVIDVFDKFQSTENEIITEKYPLIKTYLSKLADECSDLISSQSNDTDNSNTILDILTKFTCISDVVNIDLSTCKNE